MHDLLCFSSSGLNGNEEVWKKGQLSDLQAIFLLYPPPLDRHEHHQYFLQECSDESSCKNHPSILFTVKWEPFGFLFELKKKKVVTP